MKLVAENREQAAISASDLKAGDAVISEGNAEVSDGMELMILGGDAP